MKIDQKININELMPPPKGKRQTLRNSFLDSLPILFKNLSKAVILVENVSQALRLVAAWDFFSPHQNVIYFPDWEILPYERFSPNNDLISERLLSLWKINQLEEYILIIPVSTAMQKLPPVAYIQQNTFWMKEKDSLNIQKLKNNLVEMGYQNVSSVISPGEFSLRGSLIDLFPMGSDIPYRIDFLDDDIDSIRSFNPDTQKTIEKVRQIRILPAFEFPTDKGAIKTFRVNFREHFNAPTEAVPYKNVTEGIFNNGIEFYFPLFFSMPCATIFDYLQEDTTVILFGEILQSAQGFEKEYKTRFEYACGENTYPPLEHQFLYIESNELFNLFKKFPVFNFSKEEKNLFSQKLPDVTVNHKLSNPIINLQEFKKSFQGKILICAENLSRIETINSFFKNYKLELVRKNNWLDFIEGKDPFCIVALKDLIHGFVLLDEKIAVITEIDLYKYTARNFQRKSKYKHISQSVVKDLIEIKIGDFVVHEHYGIGIYQGLSNIKSGDETKEFMLICYKNQSKLYVPITQLAQISRYTGQKLESVNLSELGSGDWKKFKEKAIKRAYDTAADLLELYAQRQLQQGHSYTLNLDDYNTFIDGFEYVETDDQLIAINKVIQDMTQHKPMDRLICGDVGFGKTEIALRAAFIAVMDGKQVAILAPTTLLVEQHYKIFSERFINFPVNVKQLSRFVSARENKIILEEIQAGKVDIVIGTHKLLQPTVKFVNLGLVVIDEEHRFGVRQKEELKKLRHNIDVLTMTATPIPRTLSMAIEGIRDFSLITTAPQKRLSVKTFISHFSEGLIREAVLRELKRNGQVFFVHNEVNTIENMREILEKIVPEARIAIAHGQLNEKSLEHIIKEFVRQKYNILLCSTIIETGIDIPNVNTIIINRADKFGIAQLHQLRGRVGRSFHQAYAYLLTGENVSRDALKRLEAIKEASSLGAGFMLAMQDLEIRGSGEILGDDQSGEIIKVGLNLYAEILKKAVSDIKENKNINAGLFEIHNLLEINLGVSALIPDNYCYDVTERLKLYKRLSNAESLDELLELKLEIEDRFGKLPQEVLALLQSHKIRLKAQLVDIVKIETNDEGVILTFKELNQKIAFEKMIQLIQNNHEVYKLIDQKRIKIMSKTKELNQKMSMVEEFIERIKK